MSKEIVRAFFGGFIRWMLTGVSFSLFGSSLKDWLVAKQILTAGQVDMAILGIGAAVGTLVWSLVAKYRSRLKLFAALDAPAGSTLAQVNEKIADAPASKNLALVFKGE
jgi:hypothetical protein